jgi:hypothetical protein
MKRKTLALTLIWAIVISAVVAGIMLVNLAVANPEAYH